MERILILNLKRNGDIVASTHLINSILNDTPNAQISMLVYEEFSTVAHNILGVSKVYTLDRKKISLLKKNKIFSNGHSMELVWNSIKEIRETEWNHIINYSNDIASAYLTSFLKHKKHTGIKINKNKTIAPSNDWTFFFNEVLPSYPHAPLHFVEAYHKMVGVKHKPAEISLRLNQEHNETAHKNINLIRKKYSRSGKEAKIIGIQIKSASLKKDLPVDLLVDFVDELINHEDNYIPMLLVAPNEVEKKLANKINESFNNKIISVETDFIALPSVLYNIDALVTPDTVTKHFSDLTDTPTLEIALGSAPIFKQGTIKDKNIILTPVLDCFPCTAKSKCSNDFKCQKMIKGKDISIALDSLINKIVPYEKLSDGLTLYQTHSKESIWFKPIAGDINVQTELTRQISRLYVDNLFNEKKNDLIFTHILEDFDSHEITTWIKSQNEHITQTIKDILNCLRSLRTVKDNKSNTKRFLSSLDKLMIHCTDNSLTAIPSMLFRGRIETISTQYLDTGLKQMEDHLYLLKNEVHGLITLFASIHERKFKSSSKAASVNI